MSDLASATASNTSFSKIVPTLQLAVDSHSLGTAKTCLRLYYYSIILGYQPRDLSVHLRFGLLMHGARERYQIAKTSGLAHDEALREVVVWVLEETFDKKLGRPWASEHKTKNRMTLLRTVIWYLDQYEYDSLETIILASGRPAIELAFQFDTGATTKRGERWTLCGRMDRLVRLGSTVLVDDLKTTSWTIDGSWFSKFTPHNQFSLYCLAGQVAFATPTFGLVVDGIQIATTFSRFERGLVPRPPAILDEWLAGTHRWLEVLEICSEDSSRREALGEDPVEAWPMNEMACGNYSSADGSRGGCPFRSVCSRAPGSRKQWIEKDFRQRVWDPLVSRGDI